MATTVDNYKVKVSVEGSQSLNNLKQDMEGLSQIGGPLGGTINGIISKLGPLGVAAGVAATAFAALGGRALSLAGELSDIAGATGIAAGTLMNFRQSVVEAGGKADDFAQIAAKLNQSVQEANSGNEKFQKSFRDLGVFVTDANGKLRPTGDILQDIIGKFRSGELSSSQYAAAIDILGKNINKLELAKLQAVADPIKDEQIRQLDKYNEAIDRLTENINTGLIKSFGQLAIAINNAFDNIGGPGALRLEKLANERGQTYRSPDTFIGRIGEAIRGEDIVATPRRLRDMTEQEKAAYKEREEAAAAHANEIRRQLARTQAGAPAGAGGFGATPESVLNARAASEKKINESRIEQSRQSNLAINSERLASILLFSDQQTAIEQRGEAAVKEIKINTQAEISKARLDIFAQEKLSEAEKQKEFATKEKELKLKEAAEIAKSRIQISEQLTRERERIQDIITQSKARVDEEARVNDVLAQRNRFSIENATATDRERERAQRLFDLEEERLKVLRQIALIKDIPPTERLAREQEINAIFATRRQLTVDQQAADRDLQRNFNAGFEKAFKQYVEDAEDNFAIAGRLFRNFTQGMEDAFVDFAKTGKFEWKNFLSSILEQLLRSQIQQNIARLFGGGGGGGGGVILPFLRNILGFANGGIIPTNAPVIVGERGPELLMGAAGRQVVPNGQFGGTVVYNINAVDAASFKALVARDPAFIYAVTEQGRATLPRTRR
jgi:lambda family phage tail tape measure protein